MIRYKVVNKNRGSCTVSPQNHKYYRKYNKGDTVYAEKDSFGIMVFSSKGRAEQFRRVNFYAKILRVRPVGKALEEQNFVFRFARGAKSLARFYKKGKGLVFKTPQNTLFYRAVKVLD